MHDIRLIREDPEAFDRNLARRGLASASEEARVLDKARRDQLSRAQELQAERNALAKASGARRAAGERDEKAEAEAARLRDRIAEAEAEAEKCGERLDALLRALPNRVDDDVPDGPDETANREEARHGTPPSFDFTPREHWELGERLGAMNFTRATWLSGARFVTLSGPLARMHRALAAYMLDMHVQEHGYEEQVVPHLVRDAVVLGTGHLPKFADDLFRTEDGRWLIPTAEVPLTALHAEELLAEAQLPLRLAAHTPCYRSEAGSAGRDTRGMLRQHQFEKVELVSIVRPEESEAELERMRGCAEKVLQGLGLPYRVVTLCTGDIGFAAAKTYDLEVWMPGQGVYREISSCSNCRDFQARRLGARYRPEGSDGAGSGAKGGKGGAKGKQARPAFVHTLNGSGVAVGRALIAVIENGQRADGAVVVPQALRGYMGGLEVIEPPAQGAMDAAKGEGEGT